MIIFLLEKVIRCAQMSVDCLRASKLVTLGYNWSPRLRRIKWCKWYVFLITITCFYCL